MEAAKEIWPNTEKIIISMTGSSNEVSSAPKAVSQPVQRVDIREEIAKIDEEAKQKVKQKPEISDALEVFGGDIIRIE